MVISITTYNLVALFIQVFHLWRHSQDLAKVVNLCFFN